VPISSGITGSEVTTEFPIEVINFLSVDPPNEHLGEMAKVIQLSVPGSGKHQPRESESSVLLLNSALDIPPVRVSQCSDDLSTLPHLDSLEIAGRESLSRLTEREEEDQEAKEFDLLFEASTVDDDGLGEDSVGKERYTESGGRKNFISSLGFSWRNPALLSTGGNFSGSKTKPLASIDMKMMTSTESVRTVKSSQSSKSSDNHSLQTVLTHLSDTFDLGSQRIGEVITFSNDSTANTPRPPTNQPDCEQYFPTTTLVDEEVSNILKWKDNIGIERDLGGDFETETPRVSEESFKEERIRSYHPKETSDSSTVTNSTNEANNAAVVHEKRNISWTSDSSKYSEDEDTTILTGFHSRSTNSSLVASYSHGGISKSSSVKERIAQIESQQQQHAHHSQNVAHRSSNETPVSRPRESTLATPSSSFTSTSTSSHSSSVLSLALPKVIRNHKSGVMGSPKSHVSAFSNMDRIVQEGEREMGGSGFRFKAPILRSFGGRV
jgi:hypothetical protein